VCCRSFVGSRVARGTLEEHACCVSQHASTPYQQTSWVVTTPNQWLIFQSLDGMVDLGMTSL
jgi:hypothetical protein